MNSLHAIAAELGELVERKRQQYGDSIHSSGEILRILFPNGAAPAQLHEVLLIARTLDKLQRVATGSGAGSHSDLEEPWNDIAGYGICGVAQQRERAKERCASASSQGAEEQSTEAASGSAVHDASAPITTSASVASAKSSTPRSPSPCASGFALTGAAALDATARVSARRAVLESGRLNNWFQSCAWCEAKLTLGWFVLFIHHEPFRFHTVLCARQFKRRSE